FDPAPGPLPDGGRRPAGGPPRRLDRPHARLFAFIGDAGRPQPGPPERAGAGPAGPAHAPLLLRLRGRRPVDPGGAPALHLGRLRHHHAGPAAAQPPPGQAARSVLTQGAWMSITRRSGPVRVVTR